MIPPTRGVSHCVFVASFNLMMLRLKRAIGGKVLDEDDRCLLSMLLKKLSVMQKMAQERSQGRYATSTERSILDPILRELAGVWPGNPTEQYQSALGFLERLIELGQGLLDRTLKPGGLAELQEKMTILDRVVGQYVHRLANAA